jgi:hypothetical protein
VLLPLLLAAERGGGLWEALQRAAGLRAGCFGRCLKSVAGFDAAEAAARRRCCRPKTSPGITSAAATRRLNRIATYSPSGRNSAGGSAGAAAENGGLPKIETAERSGAADLGLTDSAI